MIVIFWFLLILNLWHITTWLVSMYETRSSWKKPSHCCCFFFLRFYLFVFREKGGEEKEREKNIDRLSVSRPQLRTWPATQACA